MKETYDVIVIGGGPSGMIAAGRAAELGRRVLLLERNNVLGVKLRITGNGRCNLTNMISREHFTGYYTANPRFLHNAFAEFFNRELIALLKRCGLNVKVEDKNRVFPASDKSGDVVRALEQYLDKGKVETKCRSLVTEIVTEQNQVSGVKTKEGGIIFSKKVIAATGGKSYPNLGSNGSGYRWAKKFGHSIVEIHPGLVGIEIKEPWVNKLQGISIKNAAVSLYINGRMKKRIRGDLVFTHYGISGPGVFDLSMHMPVSPHKTEILIKLDMLADEQPERLTAKIDEIIKKNPGMKCKNISLLNIPKKIWLLYLWIAKIDANKSLNQLRKKEKRDLINKFKGVQLTVRRLRPLKEAMVSRGGVSVNEIEPNTMQSKIIKGLYFCGEVLDIAGVSGGFNLQAAFSTGYAAGTSSAGR